MDQRIDLHDMICEKIEKLGLWTWDTFNFEEDEVNIVIAEESRRRVYYQPPENVKLIYPCVIYSLDDIPAYYANNLPYGWRYAYRLTVIDRDPDSPIREKMLELPMCKFQNAYKADNLNHYSFQIYH